MKIMTIFADKISKKTIQFKIITPFFRLSSALSYHSLNPNSSLERIWGLLIGYSYYFESFCFLLASFLHLMQSHSSLCSFISKENLLNINSKILQNSNELFGLNPPNAFPAKNLRETTYFPKGNQQKEAQFSLVCHRKNYGRHNIVCAMSCRP